jgi:hypothetical protein
MAPPRRLLLLCAAAVCALCAAAAPAEAYRGPHGKARIHRHRRERAAASGGGDSSTAAPPPRLVLPPGGSLPARSYAERITLCVTSGCVAIVGGRDGPPEAEPLCASASSPAVPACAALGGPGAGAVSLANVGRGTAVALELVSSPAAEEVEGGGGRMLDDVSRRR